MDADKTWDSWVIDKELLFTAKAVARLHIYADYPCPLSPHPSHKRLTQVGLDGFQHRAALQEGNTELGGITAFIVNGQ